MTIRNVRHVAPIAAILGEGPAWVTRDQTLWFVDIKAPAIHRYDPATDRVTNWDAPAQVGWVLPARGGGFIAGLQRGIERFDPIDGGFTPLFMPEPDLPGNRLNDATTDAHGRIWCGSMADGERQVTGRLYRVDADGVQDSGLPPVAITNGPAISPDGRTLYHTDTVGRTIHAVDLNDDGTLGAMRPFVTIPAGEGNPDGCTIDSAGYLWSGIWGAWCVRRYAPDGTLAATVPIPASNVTKITFGGPGLRTAYVTTARHGLDAAALAAQPMAGDLFAFDVDVPGLPLTEAAI